jgi:hypothetical protein
LVIIHKRFKLFFIFEKIFRNEETMDSLFGYFPRVGDGFSHDGSK